MYNTNQEIKSMVADLLVADLQNQIVCQQSQLRTLAEAVLEVHKSRGELVYPDCVVCDGFISNERHPCQCQACQLAREIMEVGE